MSGSDYYKSRVLAAIRKLGWQEHSYRHYSPFAVPGFYVPGIEDRNQMKDTVRIQVTGSSRPFEPPTLWVSRPTGQARGSEHGHGLDWKAEVELIMRSEADCERAIDYLEYLTRKEFPQ